jgi:transcriptional regulator with XRE-family HTH domain
LTGSIAALLRDWRQQRGLSQGGLARNAGVSTSTLSRWEAGRRQPSMPELERVLAALRVPEPQRLAALKAVQAPRALISVQEQAGDSPPVTGDLLRAMRLRRGWTQAALASRIGVRQGMLAKWERSQDWPGAERLQALCYELGAHPQELAALTSGRLWLKGAAEIEETSAERIYWSPRPLRELRFLAAEAHLWELSLRRPQARSWLCTAYCFHVRALMEAERFVEVGPYVERVLSLARQGHGGDEDCWCWAVLAAAGAQARGGRPRHFRSASRLLSDGLEAVQAPSNKAWMMSELGMSLARQGQAEAAVATSARACDLAARAQGPEDLFRWRDHARILAYLGRYGEALAALEKASPLADLYADTRVRHRLLEAECLRGIGERAAAEACLSAAASVVDADGLSYLHPAVQALAAAP